MLSRVANSIYWMNRYMERAENYARFMSVKFNLILDMPKGENPQWDALLKATVDETVYREHYQQPERDSVLHFMAFDQRNPNSILSCIVQARENARSVREVISKEMWEQLNQLYLRVRDFSGESRWRLDDWQGFFNEIKMGVQLFFGIIDATITRNDAWHFGRLGRFIERADKTSRFIDVKYFILLPNQEAVGSNFDLLQWTAVLKSVSAYNMYRQAYRNIELDNIIEFLVLNRYFPRSIYCCLREAELSLLAIEGGQSLANPAIKAIGKLRAELEYTDVNDIFAGGLHEYVDAFQQRNNDVGQAIFDTYFALKPVEA